MPKRPITVELVERQLRVYLEDRALPVRLHLGSDLDDPGEETPADDVEPSTVPSYRRGVTAGIDDITTGCRPDAAGARPAEQLSGCAIACPATRLRAVR